MTRCIVCKNREVFYIRVYSGEQLCEDCFMSSIEDKVKSTIAKHEMLKMNDRIAVAVSGGKDSVSLLHLLAKVEKAFPKASLCAVTVDEGIKGYRDEAIKIAADNCKKLGIQHLTVSFKELFGYALDEIVERTKGSPLTPCAYCGVLRRRALNVAARLANANKIATAHNLDDEIQTFLLNIIHGDPLRSARGGSNEPRLVPRIKPFIEVPEKEIALYAFLKGIQFQEVPCPYASEALRNDARHWLNKLEEKHPGIKYTVNSSMQRIRQAMEQSIQKAPLNRCKNCGEPTMQEMCQTCQTLQKLADKNHH